MRIVMITRSHKRRWLVCFISAAMLFSAGCGPKTAKTGAVTALDAYVSEAKSAAAKDSASEGSLWVNSGQRSDLFHDPRAREVNDMVTIRVLESTAASSAADAKNSKNTSVKGGVDSFFGAEKKVKELPNMAAGKVTNSYEGKGSTSRVTTLQTSLAARVVDVLPNGYLVIDGTKEIRLNNETQSVHVTGVVRPEDISRDNVVLSSDVAQMTVQLQGKGVVSQTLKPNWLYNILNAILPF